MPWHVRSGVIYHDVKRYKICKNQIHFSLSYLAVDNFLRAAGIFKHIYETFTNAPSIDLKPQFLEILVALMLAQARECLYEKLLLQIESFSISNKNHVSESSR